MITTISRLAVLPLMMALGGCAIITMRGVDSKWDGTRELECSESYAPVYVDGYLASLAAGATVELARSDPFLRARDLRMKAGGAVLTSLLFTISASIGASRYKECRQANAKLYIRDALSKHRSRLEVKPAGARGYFCTYAPSLPELYTCVRERDACEDVRKALAIPDGEACASHQLAWCFDITDTSRCFGTQHACEERRADLTGAGACTQRP